MSEDNTKTILYCNEPYTCKHFNPLKAKCEIANYPLEVAYGGHVGEPRHIYARIPNCFLTREENKQKE